METGALRLRLLGGAQAWDDGTPCQALASPRIRSLVAYLVLHRDVAVPRQRLAFAFWPDSSEAQARTNLRNLLHVTRRTHPGLAKAISDVGPALRWITEAGVTDDLTAFRAAAHDALQADPDDEAATIAACRAAAAAYGGPLLPDETDQWLGTWRETLHDQYVEVLRLLATALIDADRGAEALEVTPHLLRADPLDEPAHRLHIEAHAVTGDLAGAVRAYHECLGVLDRELGISPSEATVALFERFVERPPGDRPSEGRRTRHELIGRDAEWAMLAAAWEAVRVGPPRLAVVTGEAGIGKTSLVEQFGACCRAAGAGVAVSRSYVAEGELGFAVAAGWLRAPDFATGLRHLTPHQSAQVARLLPELDGPGPAAGADHLDEAERRRRLFEAILAVVDATARPTLLVVDDAQWSDRASHEVIHYLVRRAAGPLLVVATAREEELDTAHPLSVVRDSLAAVGRTENIPLVRLAQADTTTLGQQLVGAPLDETAAASLFAESAGNPLFVVEAVRAGWTGSEEHTPLTPRLRAVIDARLRPLDAATRELVAAASVVGRPFGPDLLRALTDLDNRALAGALDELWRRRIWSEAGHAAYDFSHAKLREAVYDDLGPVVRRTHHAAVATYMAARPTGIHNPSSEIAAHFESAGRVAEAVQWWQRAAVEAHRIDAYEDSLSLLQRALDHVPLLPPELQHVRELELLSTMPVALAGVDGYGTSRMSDAHERATQVAARLGVELDPPFVRSMVMSAVCRDEFGPAREMAARLHEHAVATGDGLLRVESRYLMGIAAFWSAHLGDAREEFETVISEFDPRTRGEYLETYGHDPQVVCMSRLANTLWFQGDQDGARRTCEHALRLAEGAGHALSHDTATIFASLLALDLDDDQMFEECSARLGSLGMDSTPHRIKREALRGYLAVIAGGTTDGIARIEAALSRCQGRNFYPGFQMTIVRVLVAAQACGDDSAAALRAIERGLGLGSTPIWDAELRRVQAAVLAADGAPAGNVRSALDAATALARDQRAAGHLRRIEETASRLGHLSAKRF